MAWVIEDLAGTKDGSNTAFTISDAPVIESLSVFHTGIRYRRVTGTPSGSQYAISGTAVTMGRAPAADDNLWSRGFVDA